VPIAQVGRWRCCRPSECPPVVRIPDLLLRPGEHAPFVCGNRPRSKRDCSVRLNVGQTHKSGSSNADYGDVAAMSPAATGGDLVYRRSVVLRAPKSRALAVGGLVAGLALTTVPAAAASTAAAGHGRMVNAVVVVRPGVHLPLAVPGGHVRATFSRIGSEFVRAPLGSLMALASDPRVAGVTPDRSGTVAGVRPSRWRRRRGQDRSGRQCRDARHRSY
jgi:hypothetical protein